MCRLVFHGARVDDCAEALVSPSRKRPETASNTWRVHTTVYIILLCIYTACITILYYVLIKYRSAGDTTLPVFLILGVNKSVCIYKNATDGVGVVSCERVQRRRRTRCSSASTSSSAVVAWRGEGGRDVRTDWGTTMALTRQHGHWTWPPWLDTTIMTSFLLFFFFFAIYIRTR